MLKSSSTNCVHSKSISCTGKHNHVNTIWRQSHCRAHIMCWAGTQSVCGIPHSSIMHLTSGQCEKSSSHRWTLTGHRLALHWPGTNWPYTDRAPTGPTLTVHRLDLHWPGTDWPYTDRAHYNAHVCYQEYIRDESMQSHIPTVNNILQKWCSKTSRVGMATILLFLHNAWIQLLAMA